MYLGAVAQFDPKDKNNVSSKQGDGQVEVNEVVHSYEQVLPE